MTGLPAAWASTAVMPNSSMLGTTTARAPAYSAGELGVACAPQELGLGIGLAERGLLRPAADDADRRVRAPGGLQCDVHALVAHELGDDQERLAGSPGREPVGFHRRVDDRGLAPVEAQDPLPCELGVGDV